MPVQRSFKIGNFVFSPPYWDELLERNGGLLPRDPAAHALWHYYCIAMRAAAQEKTNLVYEGDTNLDFKADATFRSIALAHGVNPDAMLPYWEVVLRQAKALGSDPENLPAKYKFNRRSSQ